MVIVTPVHTNSLYTEKKYSFNGLIFFYKIIHVCFGLDFGFVEFKELGENVQKVFTIFQSIIICVLTVVGLMNSDLLFLPWYFAVIIQYFTYVLILVRIKRQAKLNNLMQDLQIIDFGLKVNHASYNLEIKLILFIFLYLTYRFFTNLLLCLYYGNCFHFDRNTLYSALYFLVLMADDLVRVTYAFAFYAISCRLKKLGLLLKTQRSEFLSGQYLYRSIVDIAEQHKEGCDPMIIASLLFNVPQAMATLLLTVQEIKKSADVSSPTFALVISTESFSVFEMLMLTIMPAFCAGMLSTQADNIKVILHDLLLQLQDTEQFYEIERFIRYVEARGCHYRVCKVIPLDSGLLTMVLSFCVTYLIVIIQFTN